MLYRTPTTSVPVPQEEKLRGWYEELRGKLDCFELCAERLDAGFTANQARGL